MIKYIISAVLGALTILFGCLQSVWTGFSYFALSCGALLSLMWAVIWLIDYFVYYQRENLEERYKLYCAVLVNTTALTLDIIKQHDKIYYKKFKRTLLKEKTIDWLKIMFAVGLFIAMFLIFI